MKKLNKFLLISILAAVACATGGWITNQRVTLDTQVSLLPVDETTLELVPAVEGRIPVLVALMIGTDTEQGIVVTTGNATLGFFANPFSTGIINLSDGVVCYGSTGHNISISFTSPVHNSSVYARYRYQ